MAENEQNTPDISEFEAKVPASGGNRKDTWLLLIIIDVVLLCIFGFFLYKNLSAKLLAPVAQQTTVEETLEMTFVPEEAVFPEDLSAQKEPEVLTAEEVIQPAEPEKEPVKETVQPQAEVAVPAAEAVAQKKESVLVQTNPKSKYRQVTFRYFGPAKEVAVVSGFTMSKPRAMSKKDDAWEVTLAIAPGTYKYLFVVDGKNTKDPYAPEKDGRSLLVLE